MHLIAVRSDLLQFQHVHPQPTGTPGEYALEVAFPEAGTYFLYNEFVRANGQDILLRDTLAVGDGAPTMAPSTLVEDLASKEVASDARVTLQQASDVRAGQETELRFRLDDPRTGEPVRDLQSYLGAPAHVVILDGSGQSFAHTHGEQVGVAASGHGGGGSGHGAHDTASAAYGPEIAFHHTFSTPGLYKIWGQFRDHHGQVLTADFVVRVN
jgi:Cu+-exporting ATPase